MKKYKLIFVITLIFILNCAWIFHWSLIGLNVHITTINTLNEDVMVKEDVFSGRLFPYFVKANESVTKTLEYESTGWHQGIAPENATIKLLIFTLDSSGSFTKLLMEKTIIPEVQEIIPWDYDDDITYNDTIIIQ